ncbi:helicase-associated domain-containing protein [Frigoribacterium sp. 2-23]|uniref:helicase-associated domain-containing protein n=1 Tax=Frigoribacterium sp. 2-23 TaxID=3415006 RepID=UPI003C6FC629
MASALDLAGVLRAGRPDDLVRRLSHRVLRTASVRDAFDLADALLEASSVRDAVSRLPRTSLLVLQAARVPGTPTELLSRVDSAVELGPADIAAAVDQLVDLYLVVRVDDVVSTLDAVADRLDENDDLDVGRLSSEHPPVVLQTVADIDRDAVDNRSAERLYAVVIEVGELLRALEQSPARELAKGGLALPEARRLAEAARVDVADIADLLRIAVRAGLAAPSPDGWTTTQLAAPWLTSSWPDRWESLAGSWLASLPSEILAVLHERVDTSWGEPLREFAAWMYPAGDSWIDERIDQFAHSAEILGLTSDESPTSAAVALLREGSVAARSVVADLLPDAIDSVYLQHDLTVVAPGPLAPAIDARLRTIATVESAGLAASYRITEAGIQHALTEGETSETLREFLSGISSTGIPQPLDYLIQQSADRHGRYRVHAVESPSDGFATRVTAVAAPSLETLQVDQALSPLSLRRLDELTVGTRVDAEAVFWALHDERYPVIVVDADGEHMTPPTRRRPRRPAPVPHRDPVRELVDRLHVGEGDSAESTDRAWIARQLDAAVKGRLTVTVTISMPDGSTSHLVMEPTGIGGGRIRGRDKKSDVERTLPLSSIVAVASGA